MSAKSLTIKGFLNDFKTRHEQVTNRRFCFLLGAGASVQSGIPSGKDLVAKWLEELHVREDTSGVSIEEWATAENLGITSFQYDKAASFYPQVFKRRFQEDPELGYAFLEKAMTDKEPSYGYSVLAQILCHTRHQVVITTNFDNLVADALSIYTRTFPLVCGHESLTGFVRPNLRYPLIAKIHRDLLLEPINTPEGTAALASGWVKALSEILTSYTPIVLGYGGNDGSLMDFLGSQPPITGGLFWCHRIGSEPEEEVKAVVEKHFGRLVPIVGFDEAMLQIQQLLNLPDLTSEIESRTKERLAAYRNQFETLLAKIHEPGKDNVAEIQPVREAARIATERITKERNWWAWDLKTKAEPDPAKAESIYREGLNDFPDSPELTGNFANFMMNFRKNYDEAERLYRRALDLDPNNAIITGNFALFMADVRKNYDEAERLYRRALELDPNAVRTGNFAHFMADVRKNYDEAERLYRRALELDPNQAEHTGSFALFMKKVRKNYDEAERLYRRALDLDPNNAVHTGNFALFMENVRKNYDEAERLYRRALELDPNQAGATGNFANFMADVRKNYDEAERLYRRALELDPNQAEHTGSFAIFMENVRKNYDEAERLHRRALELDPNHAVHTSNFAYFMADVRKNYDEAERLYRRALELDPTNVIARKNYEALQKRKTS